MEHFPDCVRGVPPPVPGPDLRQDAAGGITPLRVRGLQDVARDIQAVDIKVLVDFSSGYSSFGGF